MPTTVTWAIQVCVIWKQPTVISVVRAINFTSKRFGVIIKQTRRDENY